VAFGRHLHVDFRQQSERLAIGGMKTGPAASAAGYGTGFDYWITMRRIVWTLSLAALTVAGCASQTTPVAPMQQAGGNYSPTNASALAFDPPVLAGTPRLDLSRDGREPTAFEGFDEGSTTYYYLRTDDWYSDFSRGLGGKGGSPDNYQRRAVSETYGISYH
jgi:hypothetical protein